MSEIIDGIRSQWPYNLLDALDMENDSLEALDDAGTMEVAMAMSKLTPREKDVLRMRFTEGITLKKVGERIGTLQERARQIEAMALRKLRNNEDSRYIIKNGVKSYLEARIEEAVSARLAKKEAELQRIYDAKIAAIGTTLTDKEALERADVMAMEIKELDLSVRAYNCLWRAGCRVVGDILRKYPTYEDVMTIRNLGKKSMEEVSERLKEYRISWPAEED